MFDRINKTTCLESIKEFTIAPIDFKYTSVYELDANTDSLRNCINLNPEEEIICSTVINDKLWSILTTRRIVTREGLRTTEHRLTKLKYHNYGDYKGFSNQLFTKGFLQFDDDQILPILIETGRASMVMIYGMRTIMDETRVKK